MTKKIIFINDIDFKGSPQVRYDVRDDAVLDYAERYNAKQPMPPVDLFLIPGSKVYLIGDGLHRTLAQQSLKRKAIEANVHSGTLEDCIKFALLANAKHGLRRTNADKMQCASCALRQWPALSDRALADLAGVSHPFIASARGDMESKKQIEPPKERTGRDGKERTIKPNTASKTSELETVTSSKSLTERFPKKKGDIVDVDKTGYPIPKVIVKYWERTEEVQEILSTISSIVGALKKAQKDEDLMYAEVVFSNAIGDLDKAHTMIQTAVPYAVCATCQGHPDTQEKGCRMCKGRGLISKYRWDRLVPDEIKKLRGKAVKK
jgi:hypothetical protein